MAESPESGEEIIALDEESRVNSPSDENQLAVVPGSGKEETQIALPSDEDERRVAISANIPSFNLNQGAFFQPNFGPQNNSKHIEANRIEHATIIHHHDHHYYSGKQKKPGEEEPSTSGAKQAEGEKEETSGEKNSADEDYVKISDDIFIDDKKPLREGVNIYKGYQQHALGVRRPLAIKMIVPCTDTHVKEVQHLVNLGSHPHIVQIIHSKATKGTPRVLYIIMELCSSQNLQDYLDMNREQNNPFDFKKTMSFTKQLVSSMTHIHGNDIVHRDIKPENVLLSVDGSQLKVTDFGLGKQLRPGSSRTKTRTSGQGSDGFIPPEVYSTGEISQRGDVFSLGITFSNLWTNGKHPFGSDPYLLVYNIMHDKGLDFSGLLISGPKRDQLVDLVTKMLQHDPRLRPTMQEVADHPFFKDEPTSIVSSEQANLGISEQDLAEQLSDSLRLSEETLSSAVETIPKQEFTSMSLPPPAPDVTPSASGLLVAEMETRAHQLFKEFKFTEVVSLLKDLPPSEEQQSMLAECYLRAGDWSKARNAMNTLKTLMASSTRRVTPDSVLSMIRGHRSDSSHIKALILVPSASYLYKLDKNPNNVVRGLRSCSISCKNIVKALFKRSGRMQGIALEIGCEIILQILADLRSVTGGDKSVRALSEASCLNAVGLSHRTIGKLTEAIGFYEQGIEIMKRQFGSNDPKNLLGILLNNLANTYYSLGDFHKAEESCLQAIEAYELAQDYPNEEEKRKDVDRSTHNLQITRGAMTK